jgi:hypothetical protein
MMSDKDNDFVAFNPSDYIQSNQIQVSLDKLQKSLDFIALEMTGLMTMMTNFVNEYKK